MDFNPIRRRKVSDQIADNIRDAIVKGDYSPGDPLPAEREMAGHFGVNRSSVREALHRLEAWGLVKIRHGAGAEVADFLSNIGLEILPFLIAPGGQPNFKLLSDILDLRVELLGWTGAKAAQKAEMSAVDELEQILSQLDQAQSTKEVQRLDYDFFDQMVLMSGNRILSMLSNLIRAAYDKNQDIFRSLYEEGINTEYHHRAVKAIRERDAHAARQAMGDYGRVALGGGL
ncbi:FadR family transcriptional regulator [Myxococcota bacterium]|nr:FadR family transcriptional regulator [Myxococcota bacterium]MBU1432692.1 FadR family transcriptional regulator [Myxococcota bacterium]MBU1898007.1 FadR family transcriptional regulator [Myxococcota bacterium]